MSDLPDVYLDDSARTVAVTLTPDQRRKLLHTLRSIQRDPEIGRPYTPAVICRAVWWSPRATARFPV